MIDWYAHRYKTYDPYFNENNSILINKLWSLEDLSDEYVFSYEDNSVHSRIDNRVLPVLVERFNRPTGVEYGYAYLDLYTEDRVTKHVKLHKIVALALINNGPYDLIEHIDDNKLNNDVSNLKFSNKRDNFESAKKNGKLRRTRSIFEIEFYDGRVYRGNLDELRDLTGIPDSTLYDLVAGRGSLKPTSKHKIYAFREIRRGSQRAARLLNK